MPVNSPSRRRKASYDHQSVSPSFKLSGATHSSHVTHVALSLSGLPVTRNFALWLQTTGLSLNGTHVRGCGLIATGRRLASCTSRCLILKSRLAVAALAANFQVVLPGIMMHFTSQWVVVEMARSNYFFFMPTGSLPASLQQPLE
jgi:hypothetical protein